MNWKEKITVISRTAIRAGLAFYLSMDMFGFRFGILIAALLFYIVYRYENSAGSGTDYSSGVTLSVPLNGLLLKLPIYILSYSILMSDLLGITVTAVEIQILLLLTIIILFTGIRTGSELFHIPRWIYLAFIPFIMLFLLNPVWISPQISAKYPSAAAAVFLITAVFVFAVADELSLTATSAMHRISAIKGRREEHFRLLILRLSIAFSMTFEILLLGIISELLSPPFPSLRSVLFAMLLISSLIRLVENVLAKNTFRTVLNQKRY